MNYKPYATSKTVAQRMARKRARRETFVFNQKAKRLQRKSERLHKKEPV